MNHPSADRTFSVIRGPVDDTYRQRVEQVYEGDPEVWKDVLGESLLFHHGVYDGLDRSLEEAATAYLDAQLEIAGLSAGGDGVHRILDVGCGWGGVLVHLAKRFPACERLDGVNVSSPQLDYAARWVDRLGLGDRVSLFSCDAQDIDLLPAPGQEYDLVIARGSVAHLTNEVLEKMVAALERRTRPGGVVVIAEVLYTHLDRYASSIADTVDRLACGYRKSPEQVIDVLERHHFAVQDSRVLPSAEDALRWFSDLRTNIERRFPQGAPLRAIEELRDVIVNLAGPLASGDVAACSIIAVRG